MYNDIVNWINHLPLWAATLFLASGAFFRAQTTFWIGKLLYSGSLKTKWGKRINESPSSEQSKRIIQRYGWPIVPLSFLTIGLQSVIQLGAGLLNWTWMRYTIVALPGYLLWGFVYAAGGLALFNSIIQGSIGSLIILLIIVFVVWIAAYVIVKTVNKK